MVEVHDLFELIDEAFGRRRLLQQSPISPEVWELYLDNEDKDPEGRCDLLLTAASGADPAKIANALRNALFAIEFRDAATRPVEERGDANIAANGESVVARLTLSELVCAAVPLSWWWQRLPAWLKAGSLDWARMAMGSAEGVEFLTFAATAGLVQLITTGRGEKFIARFKEKRSQSARRRTVERSARTPTRAITDEIFEMLVAFGELWDEGDLNRHGLPTTAIDHIYPNRRSQLAVAEGRRAIKADASENLFRASAAKIVWAIVDSGVDARHPCFAAPSAPTAPDTFSSRVYETYDFSRIRPLLARPEEWISDVEVADQLADRMRRGLGVDWSLLKEQLRVPHDERYVVPVQEHGTHVAGILGANAPGTEDQPEVMGVCPDIRMLDIRIFDPKGETDEFTILSALQFLVWLNGPANAPLVNGANLSFSLVHKVRSFACGSTPVCRACENLVKANIVTVAAAGNAGYTGDSRRPTLDDRYATVSITDPGNAEAVITVGSTHKISPVTYGVSYFSSRGPTGDGRRKPDLVAPGEKIVSALPDNRFGEMDGTSMAAPHVSGAAAILMARYPELRTQPTVVKDILCRSAFDLGREKSFQGAGLVDVLHALQFHWRSNGC